MTEITMFVPGVLRHEIGGAAEVPLLAGTVREALAALEAAHPKLHRNVCDETGAVRRHINLFVNDDHLRDRGGLDAPLNPGDTIYILTAVSGG
jgi:molybdopterin converting factor small subunit